MNEVFQEDGNLTFNQKKDPVEKGISGKSLLSEQSASFTPKFNPFSPGSGLERNNNLKFSAEQKVEPPSDLPPIIDENYNLP